MNRYTFYAKIAKKEGYEISCLITMESMNKESFMFHTPSISKAEVQSKVMEVPLIVGRTKGASQIKKSSDIDLPIISQQKLLEQIKEASTLSKRFQNLDKCIKELERIGWILLYKKERFAGLSLNTRFKSMVVPICFRIKIFFMI